MQKTYLNLFHNITKSVKLALKSQMFLLDVFHFRGMEVSVRDRQDKRVSM